MIKEQASTKRHYRITKHELPLSCPLPEMRLWDAHPRVYIPLDKEDKGRCYYCGATFELVNEKPDVGYHVND